MLDDRRQERLAFVQVFYSVDFCASICTTPAMSCYCLNSPCSVLTLLKSFSYESKRLSPSRYEFLANFVQSGQSSIAMIDSHITPIIKHNYKAKLCYPQLQSTKQPTHHHFASDEKSSEIQDIDYLLLRTIMRAYVFELLECVRLDVIKNSRQLVDIILGYLYVAKTLDCDAEVKFLNAVFDKIGRSILPHCFLDSANIDDIK